MTRGRPDFTDVFYAGALQRHHALRGLRLVDEGNRKAARDELAKATHWGEEEQRLAAIVRANPFPWSRGRL